jgi:hypothetical protein
MYRPQPLTDQPFAPTSNPDAGEARKQFFFEKKNQKTFFPMARSARSFVRTPESLGAKFFWFFFSKKNCFLI